MNNDLVTQLRNSIGEKVDYNGTPCIVVEILEHPLLLVLQATGPGSVIQPNQYGGPQRRVTPVFTLPCLDSDGKGLHPELLALGLEFIL